MFEDSLMESQGRLTSPTQRWTTIASLTLQCGLAAMLVALPLLHPEALPFRSSSPAINLPLKPMPPRIPRVEPAEARQAPPSGPSSQASGHPLPDLGHLRLLTSGVSDEPPSTDSI